MKIISLHAFNLRSVTGHTVNIPANEPVEIPDVCAKEAFAAGCALVSGLKEPVTAVTEQDTVSVKTAIHKLIEANDPDSFKKDGSPKVSAIAAMVEFPVTADEVTAAWNEIQSD